MRNLLFIFLVLASTNTYGCGLDLTIFYGSRQGGLGGQQIAISTDDYAPFYNPAAMMGVENGTVASGMSPLFIQYEAPMGLTQEKRKSEMTVAPLFYRGGVYLLNKYFISGLVFYRTGFRG